MKYKQLSYYTRNYQQPILYPILQYDKYIPDITIKRDIKNIPYNNSIYNHNKEEIVNYNFSLNNKMEDIFNNEKSKNKTRCCLVKKMYHVKGIFYRKENEKDDKKQNPFSLIFISDSTQDSDKKELFCHFKLSEKENEGIKHCYGSFLPCCKKELNKKYIFESKNIMFIIERSYFMKKSAIEIFTYDPYKSYYFNFIDKCDIDKYAKSKKFHKIEDNNNNIILYYNKYYSPMLFPFIKQKKLNLEEMPKFYNNYDLLTIINILANRSYKDLLQYPVFPFLYKHCGIDERLGDYNERDMSEHVGLQPFKSSKDDTIKGYIGDGYEYEGEDEYDDNGKKVKKQLFNSYFSNPAYVSYYMIRLFPYALVGIKIQGTYFDNPNRLFRCIKSTAEISIIQKSDNREFIPELYYLPDIFINRNEFFLGIHIKGEEKEVINNCFIKDPKENNYKKYEFSAKIKNELEFDDLGVDKWIDLLFGYKQKSYSYKKDGLEQELDYYPEYMEKDFYKGNKIKSDAKIILDQLDFGMLPYQIYKKNNPIVDKSPLYTKIKHFNEKQFALEHKVLANYKIIDDCFECSGSENINYGYYYWIIEKAEYKQETYKNIFAELNYFKSRVSDTKNTFFKFIGNNLGDIKIEIIDVKNLENKKDLKIVKLRDHTKPIKYIDYNKRLNMFLSYSSDGFINIYCFPSCKLVRSIKVSEFTKGELEVVVLVSNPFPMIFTCDKDKMFIISINGELINEKEIFPMNDYTEREIVPSIDKDFGIVNDYICFLYKKISNEKFVRETKTRIIEIELPSLECPKSGANQEEEKKNI